MVNIRICPKCKKPTLKSAYNVMSGWGSSPKLVCSECDYLGFFYLEIDSEHYKIEDKNELKKEIEKINKLTGVQHITENNYFLSLYCNNCGEKLRKKSSFCYKCGYSIEGLEKENSSKLTPENSNKCIFCNTKIKKKDRYCVYCGTAIEK